MRRHAGRLESVGQCEEALRYQEALARRIAASDLLKLNEVGAPNSLPSGNRFLPKPYSAREIVGTLLELTRT
jgi:hypothetical protein